MLPKGWQTKKLHELIETADAGVSVNGEDRPARSGEFGVLKISSVTQGVFRPDQNKVIRPEELQRAAVHPIADRILVSRSNTEALVGASAYVACDHPQLFLPDKLWQLHPDPASGTHMQWLGHWLASDGARSSLSKLATGTSGSMKNIGKDQLLSLSIPVPPPAEQHRIANILSTWDQSIAATERLLANSQMQVNALLQQLLVRPAARGVWPVTTIGDLSERVQRRATEDEELPVLMISSGSGFVRQDEMYSRFMAGKSVENYIALNRGEFAYNKGNSKLYEFGCVFPLQSYERGLVPNVYVCFKLSESLHSGFYEHLFRADYLHDQLGALVNTGVRNNGLLNIRPADFLACNVPLPPLEEQRRVAEILAAATTWVEHHEHSLDLLKQEKAALMSQLLTGKRRVKLPATETEAQS
jgi:type I restriction enzyme, S subunit